MDIELLKRVIIEEEAEITSKFKAERIIEREYLAEIKKYMNNANAVVISGVRRSGKSTSAVLIARDKKYARINFDHPSLDGMKTAELTMLTEAISELKGDVEFIILDEVQNVKGWELFVSRLRETKKVIVTGSNSELMSEELASRLTGRYVSFTALPFSFREFLEYYDFRPNIYVTDDIVKTRTYFDSYVQTGGFPEAIKLKERFLAQIYSDIISKDIERRYGIRHRETFREVSKYMLSNISKEISYNKLKNIFDLNSVHTVKNYVGFLQKAYLIFLVNKYSGKLKEQVRSRKKVYSIDTGMAIALGFRSNEDKGRLLENIVALELLRRKLYWHFNTEIYYWQNYKNNEVDFVIKERNTISQLIQVCYRIDDFETKNREIKSLLLASEELRCDKLTILTHDFEGKEIFNGRMVNFIPVWKWLLVGEGKPLS